MWDTALPSFLIGLREGLEAGLIVSILIATLVRADQKSRLPQVWTGVLAAIALSLSFGAVLTFTAANLSQTQQEAFGGTLSVIAVGFVTVMVFWMRRSARNLSGEIRDKVTAALTMGSGVLITTSFLAVGREGLETALFLWTNAKAAGQAAGPMIGAGIGLVVAGGLCWGLYRRVLKINLTKFFTYTGIVLIVIAAGVLAYGLRDLQEGGVLPGNNALAIHLSDSRDASSWYGTLLQGILNLSPQMTWLQVVAYGLYLAIVMTLFVRGLRAAPAAAPKAAAAAGAGNGTKLANHATGSAEAEAAASAAGRAPATQGAVAGATLAAQPAGVAQDAAAPAANAGHGSAAGVGGGAKPASHVNGRGEADAASAASAGPGSDALAAAEQAGLAARRAAEAAREAQVAAELAEAAALRVAGAVSAASAGLGSAANGAAGTASVHATTAEEASAQQFARSSAQEKPTGRRAADAVAAARTERGLAVSGVIRAEPAGVESSVKAGAESAPAGPGEASDPDAVPEAKGSVSVGSESASLAADSAEPEPAPQPVGPLRSRPRWLVPVAVVAVPAVIAGTAIAVGGGKKGGQTIAVSPTACGKGFTAPQPGRQTFEMQNTGTQASEVYLIDPTTNAVYGEIEGLAPGTTRTLIATIGSGTYAWRCVPTSGKTVTSASVRVTGGSSSTAVLPVAEADLDGPLAAYKAYVNQGLATLVGQVKTLQSDLSSGNLTAAKTDWLTAHLGYASLGAAYGTFADFDQKINGRADGLTGGVQDANFTGFHRIEYGLWHGESAASLATVAGQLVTDVTGLQKAFPTQSFDVTDLPLRTHEILENTLQFELTGDTDEGSGTNLATAQANLAGTQELLTVLHDLISKRSPHLIATVDADIQQLSALLAAQHTAAGWTPVAQLSTVAREQINGATGQLLEDLSPIPDLLEIRKAA